jgi:hypothetical protein
MSVDSVAGTLSGDGRSVTQFTFLVRGDSGVRAGIGALSKYDFGLNTSGASATWTGATRASETNPARDWETGDTYVRRLGDKRLLSKISAYTSVFVERATICDNALAHSIGCLYSWKPFVQFDYTYRRVRTTGQPFDN